MIPEGTEKLGQHHWRNGDTEYRLTNLPTDPCCKCGAGIGEDEYCYFREGPKADGSMDHICWDCGHEVTGFGTHDSNGVPFA